MTVKCIYGCSNEGSKNEDGKEEREFGLLGSCMQTTWFCVVDRKGQWWEVLLMCTRRDLKANVVKSKLMMLNVRGLQLECTRVLHETLLVPVLMYGSEKMI